jgi:hypothetical protein
MIAVPVLASGLRGLRSEPLETHLVTLNTVQARL